MLCAVKCKQTVEEYGCSDYGCPGEYDGYSEGEYG